MTWVITRGQPEADADAAALRSRGLDAVAIPCIVRVPLEWPPLSPTAAPRMVLVSSPFAARRLIESWPLGAPVALAAMAPVTSAALERAGREVTVKAAGGVVALAHAIEQWHQGHPGPLHILYATSEVGMLRPEQREALAILKRFAEVEQAAVYATEAAPDLDAAFEPLTGKPCGLVLMSPSAVDAASWAATRVELKEAACIGQSTLERCREVWPALAARVYPSFPDFANSGGFRVKESSP